MTPRPRFKDEQPATFVCVGLAASAFPCTDTLPAAALGFGALAGSTLDAAACGDETAAEL